MAASRVHAQRLAQVVESVLARGVRGGEEAAVGELGAADRILRVQVEGVVQLHDRLLVLAAVHVGTSSSEVHVRVEKRRLDARRTLLGLGPGSHLAQTSRHDLPPDLGITELPMNLADYVSGLAMPRFLILIGVLLLYIVLGCVLVGLAMIILTIPVIYPVIEALGFNPIWFGVLMVIVLEIGLMSPPVGLNVFVMKGVARDVPLQTIFRGVIPFIVASIVCIILLILFMCTRAGGMKPIP